jgi:hypothetical protein
MTDEDLDDFEFDYSPMDEPELDFDDIDCSDCGLKFFVLADSTPKSNLCGRCQRGLPPLYEY